MLLTRIRPVVRVLAYRSVVTEYAIQARLAAYRLREPTRMCTGWTDTGTIDADLRGVAYVPTGAAVTLSAPPGAAALFAATTKIQPIAFL